MDNSFSFVDRIDDLLKKQKKNRNDLYKDLDIPKNLIGQWKQRGTIPNASIACKIADYLNTSVEFLVNGVEKDSYKGKYESLRTAVQDAIDKN